MADSVEKDAARIVGRDLSPAAANLAQREGWTAHARMHPTTAAEYEARVLPPAENDAYPRHAYRCGHSGCREWAVKGVGVSDLNNRLGSSHDCCHRHCRGQHV